MACGQWQNCKNNNTKHLSLLLKWFQLFFSDPPPGCRRKQLRARPCVCKENYCGMGWNWTAIKTDWWRVATYFSTHCTSEMYWSRSSWLCAHWPDGECRRGLWVSQPVLLLRMDNGSKTEQWNVYRISHQRRKYTLFVCPCVCLNPDECRNETTAEVEPSHTSSLLKPTSPKCRLQLGASETVETKEIFSCSWEWTALCIIDH